jgi:PPOX class probable F420-dependent enzyme
VSSLDPAARALLASARVAHLATADQYSRPHNVPIVFVWREPTLYFPLDRKPKREDDWHMLRRVRNIETNGRVSIVIDHYEEDWTKLAWVLLEGVATILEAGAERDEAARALTERYPQYAKGGLDGRPVVRVAVERAVAWRASDGPA